MRIIGGQARRTALRVPDTALRPTTDRVREALFSILMPRLTGCRFLDLFAGSGAVALEALSRGAAAAVAVDSDRRALATIRENAVRAGLESGLRVVDGDVFAVLAGLGPPPFDLVYADPPYRRSALDEDLVGALLAAPTLPALLGPDALLIVETLTEAGPPEHENWRHLDVRRYGKTTLHFYSHAHPS